MSSNVYNQTVAAANQASQWIQASAKSASASIGELATKVRDAVGPALTALVQTLSELFSVVAVKAKEFFSHAQVVVCNGCKVAKETFNGLPQEAQLGVGITLAVALAAGLYASTRQKQTA